jgi:PPK2 family polyphosphate:nucleotide phosphotransferase
MSFAHLVPPGSNLRLKDIDPDEKGEFDGKNDPEVQLRLEKELRRLSDLQERLYAEQKRSLLVVLQARDTAGKDGVLRRVAGPLDSRGVQVVNYKAPNAEELAHDYLWRVHQHVPRRGDIGFFNRSHYEDVLVVRVLDLQPKSIWKRRYDHINAFEQMLSDEGTRIVKLYLHISRGEQKKRLQERLDDPDKHWKFDEGDLKMRAKWNDFDDAYEEALSRTSTEYAPWYVIPADRKWYRDLAVARVLVDTLEEMAPEYPKIELNTANVVIPD